MYSICMGIKYTYIYMDIDKAYVGCKLMNDYMRNTRNCNIISLTSLIVKIIKFRNYPLINDLLIFRDSDCIRASTVR